MRGVLCFVCSLRARDPRPHTPPVTATEQTGLLHTTLPPDAPPCPGPAELLRAMEAVKAEGRRAAEQLAAAQQQLRDLGRQHRSGSGAGASSVRASASATSLSDLGGGEGEEAQRRLAALKASRDKLIAALDAQSAEVERLAVENGALAEVRGRGRGRSLLQGRERARKVCALAGCTSGCGPCRARLP